MSSIPEGATHLRKPEYITAWLNDGKTKPPQWLVEKYKFQGLPAHRNGLYAMAIDGEFWRWENAEQFERHFTAIDTREHDALEKIVDGYGPNHLSGFCLRIANDALVVK